jgi:hypothetical protein
MTTSPDDGETPTIPTSAAPEEKDTHKDADKAPIGAAVPQTPAAPETAPAPQAPLADLQRTARELDEAAADARSQAATATEQAFETASTAIAADAAVVVRSLDPAQRQERVRQVAQTTRAASGTGFEALLDSASAVTRGLEDMRRVWMELARHAVDRTMRGPQELLQCHSLSEVADLHRALLRDAVETSAQSSRAMLDISARTARDAARPFSSAIWPRAAE